jgi:hypothetical protein
MGMGVALNKEITMIDMLSTRAAAISIQGCALDDPTQAFFAAGIQIRLLQSTRVFVCV